MRFALLVVMLVAERGCFGVDSHEPDDSAAPSSDAGIHGEPRPHCTLSPPVLLDPTLQRPEGLVVTASGYLVVANREDVQVAYVVEISSSLDAVATRGSPMMAGGFWLVDEMHAVVRRDDYSIDLAEWNGTDWAHGVPLADGDVPMETPDYAVITRGDTMMASGVDLVPRAAGPTVHLGPYGNRGGRSDLAWPIPRGDEIWVIAEASVRQTLDRFDWDGTRLAADRVVADDAFWSAAYLPRRLGGAWAMIGTADYGATGGDFALLDVGPDGTRRRVTLVDGGVGYAVWTSAVESDDGRTLAVHYTHGELPGEWAQPGYVTVLDTTTLEVLLPETLVAGRGEVRYRDGGFTLLLGQADASLGLVTQRVVCP